MTQTGPEFKVEKEFGGSLQKKSHAIKARPISLKNAMHLTLRSSKARGPRSFLLNKHRTQLIERKVRNLAGRYGIRIYRYANVGNHLHLLLRATYRRGFIAFFRGISGTIARIALGAERGISKLENKNQFWDQRPWIRVAIWMNDFKKVAQYVKQHFDEAMGFIPYQPRMRTSTA